MALSLPTSAVPGFFPLPASPPHMDSSKRVFFHVITEDPKDFVARVVSRMDLNSELSSISAHIPRIICRGKHGMSLVLRRHCQNTHMKCRGQLKRW